MTKAAFAVPGALDTPTGGYRYDARIMTELRARGVEVTHLALPGGFPFPSPEELLRSGALLRAVPAEYVMIVDGLAFGALPTDLIKDIRAPIIALVHHPLALESGLRPQQTEAFRAGERSALGFARHVVVTSTHTAELLARDYGVAEERISVAVPGVDPVARRAGGSGGPGVSLLAVGALSPRKGYDVLIEALAGLRDVPWKLRIVGALRDPAETERIKGMIASRGLGGKVALEGAIEEARLHCAYSRADLLVIPSLYEGYGMGAIEGLAHGLALVSTTGGALAGTVPDAAALKVPPGDAAALGDALRRVIADHTLLRTLSDAAWKHADLLPRWAAAASVFATLIKELSP